MEFRKYRVSEAVSFVFLAQSKRAGWTGQVQEKKMNPITEIVSDLQRCNNRLQERECIVCGILTEGDHNAL